MYDGERERERERSSGHGSCTDKECTIPAAANSNLLTDEQWGETEHQKEKQREREREIMNRELAKNEQYRQLQAIVVCTNGWIMERETES